jgi:hypothetical protein
LAVPASPVGRHDGIDRRPIECVLADDTALEFDNRNPDVECASPFLARIDVTYFDFENTSYQRLQLVDENLTEMTTPSAVHV